MAVALNTRLIGGEKYTLGLRKLTLAKNSRIASLTLDKVANAVSADAARVKIVPGRGKLPPRPGYLSFRKGGASGSIGVDFSSLPFFAEVGSILLYPMLHEFGVGKLPKRPWLEPAVDEFVPEPAATWAAQFWERQA